MSGFRYRSIAFLLVVSLLSILLWGCVSSQDQQLSREYLQNSLSETTAEIIGNGTPLSQEESSVDPLHRDIVGELTGGSVAPLPTDPVSSPLPSKQPVISPEQSAAQENPSVSASPAATGEETTPASSSPAPTTSADAVASPSPTPEPATQEENVDVQDAREIDSDVALLDDISFGISRDALKEKFTEVPAVNNDALGTYLAYTKPRLFDAQSEDGLTSFYFDENDQLVLIKYVYVLQSPSTPLDKDALTIQQNAWSSRFGSPSLLRLTDAWGEEMKPDATLYDALNARGSAMIIWHGDQINVLANVDNSLNASECQATFYLQPTDGTLLDMPSPEVSSSWTAESLLVYFAQNELAAEDALKGKYIQLKGVVLSIARDAQGRAHLSFGYDQNEVHLIAYFNDTEVQNLLPLLAGDVVYLTGQAGGVVRSEERAVLALEKCILTTQEAYQTMETALLPAAGENETSS